MLGATLIYAVVSWFYSARLWFKGAIVNVELMDMFARNAAIQLRSTDAVDELITDAESFQDLVVVVAAVGDNDDDGGTLGR